MKKIIFILLFCVSLVGYAQTEGQLWIDLSEILRKNQKELRVFLTAKKLCYGASQDYYSWKDSVGQKFQVFFVDNRPYRLEIENIKFDTKTYNSLLTENFFIPVYGRFYYKSYLNGRELILIEE